MKKIIIILLTILTSVGFSQTKSDIINFDKLNSKLIDSLIFEEAMKQRALYNKSRMKKDKICGMAAKYQSDYMSFYNCFSHKNDKKFKDVLLKSKDRKSTRLNSSHMSESRMPSSA